jgi:hypothetical protein
VPGSHPQVQLPRRAALPRVDAEQPVIEFAQIPRQPALTLDIEQQPVELPRQAAPTQWHGPTDGLLRSYGVAPSRPVELKHLRAKGASDGPHSHSIRRFAAHSAMEPTGIEPVTSCLQSRGGCAGGNGYGGFASAKVALLLVKVTSVVPQAVLG